MLRLLTHISFENSGRYRNMSTARNVNKCLPLHVKYQSGTCGSCSCTSLYMSSGTNRNVKGFLQMVHGLQKQSLLPRLCPGWQPAGIYPKGQWQSLGSSTRCKDVCVSNGPISSLGWTKTRFAGCSYCSSLAWRASLCAAEDGENWIFLHPMEVLAYSWAKESFAYATSGSPHRAILSHFATCCTISRRTTISLHDESISLLSWTVCIVMRWQAGQKAALCPVLCRF